jgi:hypothetical protein
MSQPSHESKQKWLDANKEKRPLINRTWKLRRVYGLTAEQYQGMLVSQNNCCAICKKPFGLEGTKQGPHVDHDHSSKFVRGLLCGKCNSFIGLADEDIERLQSAIDYIVLNATPTEFHFEPLPNLGYKHTEEWKQAASERQKGNKYRQGLTPWNKGIPWSDGVKEKMRKPHMLGGN